MRILTAMRLACVGAVWLLLPPLGLAQGTTPAVVSCPPLLQHTHARLQDEKPQSLCQYAGKVLLVVNTASRCGYTGQYEGLESLYARYRDRGLVVLGFPSNDFRQELGSNQAIADFCQNTYGVRFPMFVSTQVTGPKAAPFYRELSRQAGQGPRWNFHKYLIDRSGRVVAHYPSMVEPDHAQLRADIERLLAQPSL
jgi:glutathione peroxidase